MKDGVPIIERWTGSIKSSGVDINYRRCRRQFPIARAIEVRYSERVQDFARGVSSLYRTTIISSSPRLFVLIPRLTLRSDSRHVRWLLISISISAANILLTYMYVSNGYDTKMSIRINLFECLHTKIILFYLKI